jgi:3-isopropylmalate dehydratase small subunit
MPSLGPRSPRLGMLRWKMNENDLAMTHWTPHPERNSGQNIVVGGKGFGCGSSREQAVMALLGKSSPTRAFFFPRSRNFGCVCTRQRRPASILFFMPIRNSAGASLKRERAQQGFNIVVGGKGFGCGSSREQAVMALLGKSLLVRVKTRNQIPYHQQQY